MGNGYDRRGYTLQFARRPPRLCGVLATKVRSENTTCINLLVKEPQKSFLQPLLLEFAVPGSPHFYAMHGCGSLPSATDGNPHSQLPRWLAQSDPVRGAFDIAQDPPPQPLRLPGAQGQFCQEHTVTQPNEIHS